MLKFELFDEKVLDKYKSLNDYLIWLNAPQLNEYTSRIPGSITEEMALEYARTCNQRDDQLVYAIIKDNRHVGNCSLLQIDFGLDNIGSAEMAFLCPRFGKSALMFLMSTAFDGKFNLSKLWLGTPSKHLRMRKLALSNYMTEEETLKGQFVKGGLVDDVVIYTINEGKYDKYLRKKH